MRRFLRSLVSLSQWIRLTEGQSLSTVMTVLPTVLKNAVLL